MQVNVFQLGARMHYAVPRIFAQHGMLQMLYTDLCIDRFPLSIVRDLPLDSMIPGLRRILSRQIDGIPLERIRSFDMLGLRYAALRHFSRNRASDIDIHLRFGERFSSRGSSALARADGQAVYCFNSAAREVFETARARGMFCILEQTIAPRRFEVEIIRKFSEKYPSWAEESEVVRSHTDRYIEREESEQALADAIFCGSDFVKSTLASHGHASAGSKSTVIEYGVLTKPIGAEETHKQHRKGRKLRVLTVGAVGLRKGAPIVEDIARELRDECEFRWLGPRMCSAALYADIGRFVTLCPPVPRHEVAAHYEWADVFLLPSLCEGSATVTYEAMTHGLPVVCSENTGSIVQNGVNGYICDLEDISGFIRTLRLLASDTELLSSIGDSALQRAAYGSVGAYAKRLQDVVRRLKT